MDLILAYLAGPLTLLNPCVLPVLPLVLQSALQQNRRAPRALVGDISLSFVALDLSPEAVARGAGLLMTAFGLVMLARRLATHLEVAIAGPAVRANARNDGAKREEGG